MPLPLIAIIIAAAVALAVFALAILYWDEIVGWFQSRNDIKDQDANNIAFTIKEKMATGEYNVVQGIFNKRTEEVVEGRKIRAEKLDKQTAAAHNGQDLVIYE